MLYEWRVYTAIPGKMNALNERFVNTTLRIFEKHGIKVIGFWRAVVGTSNTLYYMLAFNDMAHREKAWNAFSSDTEWIEARKETEDREGGPIIERVENILLRPTIYSPLK